MVAVCERLGWTYEQYLDQPSSFLTAIDIKISVEAQIRHEQQVRAEQRGK